MDGKCFDTDDLSVRLLRANVKLYVWLFFPSLSCSRVAIMLASEFYLFLSMVFVYFEMVFSPYLLSDCIRAKVMFGLLVQLSKYSEYSDICGWVMLGNCISHMQSQCRSAKSPLQVFFSIFICWFVFWFFSGMLQISSSLLLL